MLLSGIAFGKYTSCDVMQTKWFIMLNVKYTELSVLSVMALYCSIQFKSKNLEENYAKVIFFFNLWICLGVFGYVVMLTILLMLLPACPPQKFNL